MGKLYNEILYKNRPKSEERRIKAIQGMYEKIRKYASRGMTVDFPELSDLLENLELAQMALVSHMEENLRRERYYQVKMTKENDYNPKNNGKGYLLLDRVSSGKEIIKESLGWSGNEDKTTETLLEIDSLNLSVLNKFQRGVKC